MLPFYQSGAGKESRTLDLNLGKVALYQLSYSRIFTAPTALCVPFKFLEFNKRTRAGF